MYLHYLIPKVLLGVHITPIYTSNLKLFVQKLKIVVSYFLYLQILEILGVSMEEEERECKSIRDGNMVESLNLLFSPLVLEV